MPIFCDPLKILWWWQSLTISHLHLSPLSTHVIWLSTFTIVLILINLWDVYNATPFQHMRPQPHLLFFYHSPSLTLFFYRSPASTHCTPFQPFFLTCWPSTIRVIALTNSHILHTSIWLDWFWWIYCGWNHNNLHTPSIWISHRFLIFTQSVILHPLSQSFSIREFLWPTT